MSRFNTCKMEIRNPNIEAQNKPQCPKAKKTGGTPDIIGTICPAI
jgi:hypothetical protein